MTSYAEMLKGEMEIEDKEEHPDMESDKEARIS